MDTWNNVPKLKPHCTLIIKMIILVQCSVVLFPRGLCIKSGNVWQDTCTWQGLGGRVPWVGIEVGLSSSAPCSEQLLLGSISTPPFLQSKSQELPRYSNSKASAVWLGAFCTAEGSCHRGIWGVGLWGHTIALHLGLHAALLLKRQLSCVIFYGLPWTLPAEEQHI